MTSTVKTDITMNTALLVDEEAADAGDVLSALTDALAHHRSGRLGVTANDTHVKHLDDAFTVSADFTKAISNAGGNEALLLTLAIVAAAKGGLGANASAFSGLLKMAAGVASVATPNTDYVAPSGAGSIADKTLDGTNTINLAALDTGAAPTNYVLAPDGAGGTTTRAEGGGGAQPVDMLLFTAGETLAERDAVYLDSSYQWKKIDTNASPIACGEMRGIVNEAGGITSGNAGSVRILGEVSGFMGLTAGAKVYASTTAGGYTQTRPTVSAGGGQVALVTLGIATSTTAVLVLNTYKVEYLKRESLANGASLTVLHHSDPQGRGRRGRGYVASTVAGSSLATYASSNRDTREPLRGPSGAGATSTPDNSGTTAGLIGDLAGTDYRLAQSFQITAGRLSQFTLSFQANTGSPSGGITWAITTDNAGIPSATVLATGSFTPTPSTTNTINISDGPYLAAATTYWLTLEAAIQATDVAYQVNFNSSGAYADGVMKWDTTTGASFPGTWANGGGTNDQRCSITTSAATARDKLAQSFTVTGTQTIDTVKLWLKKVGSPTGTMTLRIETNNAGSPSGTLVDANATITVAESSLATSYGWITFDFATNFSISGSTTYWLVLSTDRAASATNYIEWGNDTSSPSYADGEMKAEASSSYSALTADGVFEIFGPATTFDEPCVIGRWSAGTRDLAVQFGDGSYANGDTQTTFKNQSGDPLDVTCIVEV